MEKQSAELLGQLLAEFDRLGVGRQVGYEKLLLYSIITHSTAIEGSTITLEENTVMFDDGLLPAGRQAYEQLMNLDLKRAYEVMAEMARARTKITLSLLTSLSALVMRNTGTLYNTVNGTYDESKGELRLQNVSAGRGGRSYLAWEKVEARTVEFIDWLNQQLVAVSELSAAAVYDLSFEVQFRLVTIHPWSDGNGRMARLLMNLVQLEGEVIPLVVRSGNKASYIQSLSASQEEGSSAPFLSFMTEEALAFLAEEIDGYKQALGQDVPWSDSPMAPAPDEVTPKSPPKSHPSQGTRPRARYCRAERCQVAADPWPVGCQKLQAAVPASRARCRAH